VKTETLDRLHDEVAGRKMAEEELHKSSQMLEAFFEHTITSLVFLDRRFNFVRVNEAYARADGKRPAYFLGKSFFALYPSPENRAIFEQVVRTRQPYRAYAKPFTFPNAPQPGVTYWNWWLTPLLNNLGEVQLLVLNLEDVTERQKAFSELQEQARQLQQLTLELSQTEDRERKHLAEILHDDLQQLLAAAKFHVGLLSRRAGGDEELLEMVGQVKAMLVEAIEKSRSLSHELSPPGLSKSDPHETFEWLTQQFQTKHGLTVSLDACERIELPSEPLRAILYKAAQEMLFNVVKHAGVTEARLRLRRRGGYICLSVSDRGRGFDPKGPGRTGGFGLLSIRERVKLLGGRMKVRSAKGRGSTFLIVVPDSQPQITQPKSIAIQSVPRHDPRAESGQYSAAGAL
jgi:PAS domain S-box-containing protein